MSKTIEQLQRRIEIVGLVSLSPARLTVGDLAGIFGKDEEMIKKDLKALREEGIAIHQIRKEGISILYDVRSELLDNYMHQYMIICRSDSRKDRLLTQIVKKKGLSAVGLIVTLQRAIREKVKVQFSYIPNKGDETATYTVDPLMLFQRDGFWRLLAQLDGSIFQFHIAKITSVTSTTKKFSRPEQNFIEEQFKYSWDTWISGDKYPIRLRINDFWAERLSNRPMVDDQRISTNGKNDHLFEGTVNSIDEVARWI
ncbi:MAG: WYL domain-containing protein, partial [Bacteroidota bacterium]